MMLGKVTAFSQNDHSPKAYLAFFLSAHYTDMFLIKTYVSTHCNRPMDINMYARVQE